VDSEVKLGPTAQSSVAWEATHNFSATLQYNLVLGWWTGDASELEK